MVENNFGKTVGKKVKLIFCTCSCDMNLIPLVMLTPLLLLAVLDDTRRIHKGDPLQQLVGHLDAHQPLQKALAELLQRGQGP